MGGGRSGGAPEWPRVRIVPWDVELGSWKLDPWLGWRVSRPSCCGHALDGSSGARQRGLLVAAPVRTGAGGEGSSGPCGREVG
jgi:hypothetical protein